MSGWKRRFVFTAFLVTIGGVLWETNDLFDLKRQGDRYSGESGVIRARFDEHGDPYAVSREVSERVASIPYSRIWSSPFTRIGICFLIAVVVGSLCRSLFRGAVTLVLLLIFIGVIVGHGAGWQPPSFSLNGEARTWMEDQLFLAKQFLLSSLPMSGAAGVGFVMGLLK